MACTRCSGLRSSSATNLLQPVDDIEMHLVHVLGHRGETSGHLSTYLSVFLEQLDHVIPLTFQFGSIRLDIDCDFHLLNARMSAFVDHTYERTHGCDTSTADL